MLCSLFASLYCVCLGFMYLLMGATFLISILMCKSHQRRLMRISVLHLNSSSCFLHAADSPSLMI